MQLFNFTIFKLTFCLVIGIILGYFHETPSHLSVGLFFLLFILFGAQTLYLNKQQRRSTWNGILTYILFISLGILTTSIHNESKFQNHYSKQLTSEKNSIRQATIQIKEILKPNIYSERYVVQVKNIDHKEVTGTCLLNIEKDSLNKRLEVDHILVGAFDFKPIAPPLNPNQFDYRKYLKRQYIQHQIFTRSTPTLLKMPKRRTLRGLAATFRNHIIQKLKPFNFNQEELAVIQALILGQRQSLSNQLYQKYINAGAVHILAVSGLHVGIILLILSTVLRPIERFKHGKLVKTTLLVILLWSFAFIAGLSASIVRAVTMFSILAVATNLKRPTNTYNTLTISMFIILLFKPLSLFDVGFQLSYLAVFSIVSFDPLIYKLLSPKNWIIDKLWHTLTVTISAQLGILPLSLFYFHQFPGLFFVSNLLIIPFLGIVLGLGILIIALALINLLPQVLADAYGDIIKLMNSLISLISQQDTFIFKHISFNALQMLAVYILIIACFKLIRKWSYNSLAIFLIAFLCVQSVWLYEKLSKTDREFIVFHTSRSTLIGKNNISNLLIASDLEIEELNKSSAIRNYTIGHDVDSLTYQNIEPVYQINESFLMIIDSNGVYNTKSIKPEYVLLRQSPKINLNRLIDSLKPEHIIADGSNFKTYIDYWERTCIKRKIPFHQTGEKGAFIIKQDN